MDRRVTSPTWGPLPPCKQAHKWFPSYYISAWKFLYRKSSIKPLGGLIYFNPIWGGEGEGLNRDGELIWVGGLVNLETTMVSVLHEGLEYKNTKA